jgi:hypothetical protein
MLARWTLERVEARDSGVTAINLRRGAVVMSVQKQKRCRR